MKRSVEFSPCGKYRYQLNVIWDESLPAAMCIGLNPSTANATMNDPTITKLLTILDNNKFGGLYMTNLFGLISPYPEDLRSCPDPVKDNDVWLDRTAHLCVYKIFCWGNFKQAEYRAKAIKNRFPGAFCFGKNSNGSPKHPLYLKSNTLIQSY